MLDQDVIDLDKLKLANDGASNKHGEKTSPGRIVTDDINQRGQEETIPVDVGDKVPIENGATMKAASIGEANNDGGHVNVNTDRVPHPQPKVNRIKNGIGQIQFLCNSNCVLIHICSLALPCSLLPSRLHTQTTFLHQ